MAEKRNFKVSSTKLLGQISFYLDKMSRFIVAFLMAAICLVVLFGVVNRFIFKLPVSWTEELARFLMVWICMIGAAVALRATEHIGITFLLMKLKKTKKLVITFNYVLVCLFLIIVFIWGLKLCASQRLQLSAAMRLSMFWPFLAIPAGSFIMIAHLIFLMSSIFKPNKTPLIDLTKSE
ncbi:TRAP transporter small permease [Acidobacteriota bacterium]